MAARDGLQNLPPPAVPTPVKTELIKRLLDSGLKTIEVGSFVRADRVPQVSLSVLDEKKRLGYDECTWVQTRRTAVDVAG